MIRGFSVSLAAAPLRTLRFVRQCGASGAGIVSMLLLQMSKAILDALSALLLAALLTTLLPLKSTLPGWYLQLQALLGSSMGGLLSPFLLLLLGLILFKGLLSPAVAWLRGRLIDQWILLISMKVFADELLSDDPQRLSTHVQGGNVSVNYTVPRIVMGSLLPVLDLLTECVVVMALLGFLLVQEPQATLAMVAALGAALGAVFLLSQRLRGSQGRLRIRHQTLMQRWVTDSLAAMREVRLYRLVPEILERYRPLARGLAHATARERTLTDIQSPAMELLFLLILGAAVVIASDHAGAADMHSLALFSALGLRLTLSFRRMVLSVQAIQFSRFELERAASRAPGRETVPGARASCARPQQEDVLLECESLYYRYPGTSRDVINDLRLVLRRGEWLGLVGESGAGKSTLVDLLIGEHQPSQGAIHWQFGIEQGVIGYVGSSTTLIPGTLRDNVTFLSPGYKDEQVLDALKVAAIDSLVERFPEGLDVPVEAFELRISNGERQRIGLARALLHSAGLLILDEATASLDQLTEARFLTQLRAARPGLAVLLITHRLSALVNTDRNVIMANGALDTFVMSEAQGQVG
ncbi:ABC transporter ATP-binding protein [Pseudomonas sp. PDM16]|uniref:ATP-binding cassette domain-containing protein n=1 Tax=Pseudomonas sp. PDM16 TaxID=2769292 RepID=UPI00177B305D|nr:ABC transporter ATP-binding protein [Pseudomonas sp. PDM16]MBD9415047.1 ABC transporter ATP-binding protein [Pseudomonas sp. PDM16]